MKRLFIALILVISTLSIGACSFVPTPGEGGGGQNPGDKGDDVSWAIVYSADDAYDANIQTALEMLDNALLTRDGKSPKQQSDGVGKNQTNEIVLGNTDRLISSEASENLLKYDTDGLLIFTVKASGGDIAICGNNQRAVKIGAEWFIKNYSENTPDDLNQTMFATEAEYAVGGASTAFHSIEDINSVASLNGITVNGAALSGFNPSTATYDIAISVRAAMPEIKVDCPAVSKATVNQATDDSGRATVTVTSADGKTSKTYTFNFNRNEYDVMDAKIEKVYGGRDAIVVIVHDDGTHATVDYMVNQFKSHKLVGTLGLITKNLVTGKSSSGRWMLKTSEVNYWKSILNTGVFDVASHSHTHTFWGISDEAESGWYLDSSGNLHQYSYEAGRITEEVAGSKEILISAFGQKVMAFIKPGFGRVSDENGTGGMTQISDKAFEIIAENYIGMRNTGGGVETIPATNVYSINSHTVKAEDTAKTWQGQVNSAISSNGMIVFLFHQITNNASGLTANQSETDVFFEWLGDKNADGTVWNTYLTDAILYTEEYKNSNLSVIDNGETITVNLTHDMDNEVYNHELTVRIPIPTDSQTVSVKPEGGRAVDYEVESDASGRYILLDIVPNSKTITITPE